MRDYISIGSVPFEEDCIQVGKDNYHEMSRIECRVFIDQLTRIFGKGTENNKIRAKSFPHDFGSYLEVVVFFDDEDQDSLEYAFKVEGEFPAKWDEEALKQLNELGYKL